MHITLGLSSPVYEIPFDDDMLIVTGRITLLWGQIVFHLDRLLGFLMGFDEDRLIAYETKSLRTKLADLQRELSKPANAKGRKLLRCVHNSIDQLSSDRNVVFHGLWGFFLEPDGSAWASSGQVVQS